MNKVGPYFNPHETYHYYSLPVCVPDEVVNKFLFNEGHSTKRLMTKVSRLLSNLPLMYEKLKRKRKLKAFQSGISCVCSLSQAH